MIINTLSGKYEIFNKYLSNFLKILLATIFMCLFLYFGLDYFEDKFEYSYKFKLKDLVLFDFSDINSSIVHHPHCKFEQQCNQHLY